MYLHCAYMYVLGLTVTGKFGQTLCIYLGKVQPTVDASKACPMENRKYSWCRGAPIDDPLCSPPH